MSMDVAKRAFVTFLAGNGDYIKGVVGLAKGLRKANTRYPLVVVVLPDVPDDHRRILRSQGCIVREIEPVYPPENQTKFVRAYFVINYSKLRIWEFEEYEKMIYLDADIQVFDNIDHLFDLPNGYFYAVMDCFCDKSVWSNSPQNKIGYCQQRPEKVKWPAGMGSPPPLYFNAGMFVFEPNLVTYSNLLEALKVTTPTTFAEQDFLNMFFKDVYKPIPNVYNLLLAMLWLHPENVEIDKVQVVHYSAEPIPNVYNLLLAMLWLHPENVEIDKVKVVHYSAEGAKPWRYTGQEQNMEREEIKMFVKKWWDIYEDESLDFDNSTKKIV
ncbi:hypothetical protein L484_026163 [Morus notabilis]|uniref:Hexosyltransferase n=1 Tax=Morus notabilis TaxID=981085 RepID=W9RIS4_9ROSA|nr:hypothetical protein L484_026163 [Morus notabilis]